MANLAIAPALPTTLGIVLIDRLEIVRAGLARVLDDASDIAMRGQGNPQDALAVVEEADPEVVVVVAHSSDPDPYQSVASLKAMHPTLRVVVVAESLSVVDLREAVVAGADSLVLLASTADELLHAVRATAAGERIISSEIAMELARVGGGAADAPASLTPREREVLQLLAEGLTNQQVGKRLGVSARTIKTHVQHLLAKLRAADRTGAVARGFRLGLIS